ncbi:Smr/MutS family protein [Rhizobium rosettiformans]|uniref:DNA mismatch repair protein MutS n=2 Tax=Rhizobium rosettiformans TaxID=1368430 RepID=A0A4S8Q3T4_9HYPH|nr:Smr/MutS family protein [Rhizobium rosettiformans]MBA4796823.1 Smr/MutS family protein [Hyphomicrobiales bacterium]MBB5275453.1 DNA-nicking Smr family endonuclease [Rhizobium rosettiformans]MDR7030018.1 DNA-nicking Smr family endonuclease [Rhizobium rosettiformans]MDR7066001.1 DNA-nicking Smr family endonuclease [Rhizobium rosettiformans]THV37212.1 DNA mismatch repair protein MutS [Rhizobium rosettiformans W3]
MSGGPKLNPEDRILWGKVARSTRPMPGRMEELLAFEDQFEAPPEEKDVPALNRAALPSSTGGTEAERKRTQHLHHPLEKPVKRKLSRGHLALEARIDLHGLIQSEAHGMLLDFLIRAHERGLRHVLVITGKGSSLGSEGALKRAVPLWFAMPEFRFLISSYEPAARQHGGEGALYVRLSRRGQER